MQTTEPTKTRTGQASSSLSRFRDLLPSGMGTHEGFQYAPQHPPRKTATAGFTLKPCSRSCPQGEIPNAE